MKPALLRDAPPRDDARPPLGGPARQVAVHELYDRAALADRRRDPFERSGAHVAGGVDPGTLVSSRLADPAAAPVKMKPSAFLATVLSNQPVHGSG